MTLQFSATAKTTIPQSVRFLFAGGLAAAVNWLVRFPFSLLLPYGAAVVAANVVGMTAGFVLYRTYVFWASDRTTMQQIRNFVGVNILTMAVTALVAVSLNDWLFPKIGFLPAREAVAHAFGIAAGALVSYLGHGALTFSAR